MVHAPKVRISLWKMTEKELSLVLIEADAGKGKRTNDNEETRRNQIKEMH